MKFNTIFSVVALALAAKASAECFAKKYGKSCCKKTNHVVLADAIGKWGVEYGRLCGIEPVDYTYWKKVDYMDKVQIEEFCPADLIEIKEGVDYPTVDTLTYYSTTTQSERPLSVLVPPNYDPKKKYPVLYLLHGMMMNGSMMLYDDFGTVAIPGNLAHQKKAKEMFIVLPDQYAPAPGTEVEPAYNQAYYDGYENFINDLVNDLMPFMKKQYSIKTGRENTAIAGYSFGGRNSLYIGFTRSDLFGYVGAFSPAPGLVPGDDTITGHFDGLFQEDELKPKYQKPILLMISYGTNDTTVFDTPKHYHEVLTKNNQKHIWYEITGAEHVDSKAITSPINNFISSIFGQLNKKSKV